MAKRLLPEITLPTLPPSLVFASYGGVPRALAEGANNREAARALIFAAGGRGGPDPDAAAAIKELTEGLEGFKAKFEERLTGMEAHLDDQARVNAALKLNGGTSDGQPSDPAYRSTFAAYFRKGAGEEDLRAAQETGGRGPIMAAMSEGSNSDGGYLAPVEWDRQIRQAQVAKSPMRQLATVIPTARSGYSTLWNNNQWGSGWVGETASRPATSTPSLTPIIFNVGEIYASPTTTQRILDDAAVDVENWLSTSVETEFNRQEGIAFVAGDGVNKPAGFLTYVPGATNATAHPGGSLDVVASGQAATLGANANAIVDLLTDFAFGLAAPYRANAVWLMNSTTAATIAKLKDANGNLIWRESLIVGVPATLLGRPVMLCENMPGIGAGALPIAFGDFRAGYLINDRIGVRVLRDPYSIKGFVTFYTTKRVGGGVLDPRAIRVIKVAAS